MISVDRIEGLKKIVLKVVDEEGNVLLTTRCNNSFYKEPTSGTPGGASGGTGTPVITTPSAPGTSTGSTTGENTGGAYGPAYLVSGILFFIVCFPLSTLASRWEQSLKNRDKRKNTKDDTKTEEVAA